MAIESEEKGGHLSIPSPLLLALDRRSGCVPAEGLGGEGVTHCACDEGIGLRVGDPRDGYRV